MPFTKYNHYNPCFWTALWNPRYFQAFLASSDNGLVPRNQTVYVLNVKSDKIYQTTVENVHREKDFGAAKITFAAAKRFCKRYHPDRYDEFVRNGKSSDYPVWINFEDVLTTLEATEPYRIILDVARQQGLTGPKDKGYLTNFIFLQRVRSQAVMGAMIEAYSKAGLDKFELFVLLQWALSSREFGLKTMIRLDLSHWTIYRTAKDMFPLSDCPILIHRDSVMVALSPRLLLEISPNLHTSESEWSTINEIGADKLEQFRCRTIGSTFREIIFSDRRVLADWQKTKEFRQRVKLLSKVRGYNAVVSKNKDGELWLMNAWGDTE